MADATHGNPRYDKDGNVVSPFIAGQLDRMDSMWHYAVQAGLLSDDPEVREWAENESEAMREKVQRDAR